MAKVYVFYRKGGIGMGAAQALEPKCQKNLINISKMVLYFANHTSTKLYQTKLNKLLFYAQFLHFKKFNIILTG